MAEHNEMGKWGEQLAADYLRGLGYEILALDWRFGHRDIDIVARSPKHDVVFVEVKTRSSDVITKPEQAVDIKKIRNVGIAANAYVKQNGIADNLRFDIISIVGKSKETAEVEHIKDAFNPCLAYR